MSRARPALPAPSPRPAARIGPRPPFLALGALLSLVSLVGALAVPGCGRPASSPSAAPSPIPNLGRVDDGLFRSAQPTAEGFREAARLGVRTVLNLRSDHDDRPLLAGTGLAYVAIPMHAWETDDAAIARAVRVATDPARRPVLVHCAQGHDRTGVVVAAYRRLVDGWAAEPAVDEMVAFGNAALFANLRAWVRGLDVDAFCRAVAAATPPAAERGDASPR